MKALKVGFGVFFVGILLTSMVGVLIDGIGDSLIVISILYLSGVIGTSTYLILEAIKEKE